MRVHPYRSPGDVTASPSADGFEERAVGVVLAIAGAVGFAIGVVAPRTNATELVLGIALLAMGARTYLRARIEPVV